MSSSMNEARDGLIFIEAPPTFSGRLAGIGDHLLRATLILDMAREPRTVEEFHMELGIPIASTYRVVRALTKLGWLRVAGHRTRAGAQGVVREQAASLYVSTSSRLPLYPHPCGRCGMTLYSSEHERKHRCR